MKNKIILFLAAIFFFVPLVSCAIPLVSIRIIVNTQGTDNTFNFNLIRNNQSYSQINVPTQNLSGLLNNYVPGYGSQYLLTQQNVSGLKIDSISCTSSNPAVIFSYQTNGVSFTIPYADLVTCTFNNVKTKTPVLIVPGLTGTELFKGTEKLWPDIPRMVYPLNSDSFMDPLAFNTNLAPVDSGVYKNEVVRNPYNLYDYTEGLINEFTNQGYVENQTLFTFPYDWRYGVSGKYEDGATNADLLAQKIQDILTQTGSGKVDIVAHSLGGLIVKKYASDNPAGNNIGKAVFVGVPNTGAPKAVKILLQGDNLDVLGLNDQEIKKISQNMPAVYDLLPTRQYYNASFMALVDMATSTEKDLNFDETKSFLVDDQNLNLTAFTGAEVLHSQSFDSYDLSKEGINLYSINGCKASTIAQMAEFKFGNTNLGFDVLKITSGDGTVPFGSSNSIVINSDNVFYAIDANHGKMPSQNGTRQKIVNLISGSQLDTGDNIITRAELAADNRKCQLEGWWARLFSPVSIEVIDQNGNRSGVASDGSIQNDIPGAGYEIMGEHKFVFIPTDKNQSYTINLKGEGSGIFTFKNSQITGGQTIKTEVFSNLPVTGNLIGSVNIDSVNKTTSLAVKQTPTSQTQIILPSAIIGAVSSEDILPPASTATLTGDLLLPGIYKSNVAVKIKGVDNSSEVLAVQYNLDNLGLQKIMGDTANLTVSTQGKHILTFFSTDKAGNNEPEKTINFEIKKSTRSYARP